MKTLFPILILTLLISTGCRNNVSENQTIKNTEKSQFESENDTVSLTPAELFAASLTQDILNDDTEVELESFLADKVFPIVSGSQKVSIDKISSSLYILKYYINGVEKNLLIQKYYNPTQDEISFDVSDINTNNIKQFIK